MTPALATHPDAEVFPYMSDDEFERLADDIAAHGLIEPITLLDGVILDGRHRQRACDERGVEPTYTEWDAGCGMTPLEWVISKNLHRRHLSPSQKAIAAARAKPLFAAEAHERQLVGLKRGQEYPRSAEPGGTRGEARDKAAAAVGGVSHAYFSMAEELLRDHPELAAKVERGEITINAASKRIGRAMAIGGSDGHRERGGGPKGPRGSNKTRLTKALDPIDAYLKHWSEYALRGITPGEARVLLRKVQRVDAQLLELERALEARTVVSRALR